jgi:hypothetical protein
MNIKTKSSSVESLHPDDEIIILRNGIPRKITASNLAGIDVTPGTGIVTVQQVIPRGNATLGIAGTVTVSTSGAPATKEEIYLTLTSGNSNQTIKVSACEEGVSFTITSAGGADDAGLVLGWFVLNN